MSKAGGLWRFAAAASLAAAAGGATAQEADRNVAESPAGNPEAEVRRWRPLAERGDADAQYRLGQAYQHGRGAAQDPALAEQYYRRAAGQGHEEAVADLGLLLFQAGRRQEAMPHIQRAADQGDPRAQYVLGTALFNGDLVGSDLPRAYALMTRAAQQGLPAALSQLRRMEPYVPQADRARGAALASTLPRLATPGAPAITTAAAPVPRPSPPQTASRLVAAEATAPARPAPAASPPTAPAPARAPTPDPAASAGRWKVQLGAYGSEANARRAWESISAWVPGLQPSYSRAGNLIRLQAGPLASRAAADRACATARGVGLACIVVAP